MTLIASIITFSQKKNLEKKNVTLDPRHGTLALDMEPSTLNPRQKDRLVCFMVGLSGVLSGANIQKGRSSGCWLGSMAS